MVKKRENEDKADTRKETIDADYTQAGTKRNASLKWKTNALLGEDSSDVRGT
jgi:hypothetical protein